MNHNSLNFLNRCDTDFSLTQYNNIKYLFQVPQNQSLFTSVVSSQYKSLAQIGSSSQYLTFAGIIA